MSLYSNELSAWLLGLSLLAIPSKTAAQAATSDTTTAVSDSQPALSDSLQGYSAYQGDSDTALRVQPDSVAGDTSAQVNQDSAGTDAEGSATRADTSAKAPSDSILSAACGGPGGPTALARDLLVVVFATEAGSRERAAAVKSVKGKLLGQVGPAEPGAYYLRVPSGGEEYRLRLAADRLVQWPHVRQVGSRACPSPPASEEPR